MSFPKPPDLFRALVATRGDPRTIDRCVAQAAEPFDPEGPLLFVDLDGEAELRHMWPAARRRLVYQTSTGWHFVAAYFEQADDPEVYPFPRLYRLRVPTADGANELRARLSNDGYDVPTYRDAQFATLVPNGEYRPLLEAHRAAKWGRDPLIREFLRGRTSNTVVQAATFLRTQGCLLHDGAAATHLASTSTLDLVDNSGHLYVFTLCDECATRRKNGDQAFAEMIAERFGVPGVPTSERLTDEERRMSAERVLRDALACDPVTRAGVTVTGVRPSGLVINMRLTSPEDYAYIFRAPDQETQLLLYDSADHHRDRFPVLGISPDHRHTDLSSKRAKRESAEPSFITGMPAVDLPELRRVVEHLEASLPRP